MDLKTFQNLLLALLLKSGEVLLVLIVLVEETFSSLFKFKFPVKNSTAVNNKHLQNHTLNFFW